MITETDFPMQAPPELVARFSERMAYQNLIQDAIQALISQVAKKCPNPWGGIDFLIPGMGSFIREMEQQGRHIRFNSQDNTLTVDPPKPPAEGQQKQGGQQQE